MRQQRKYPTVNHQNISLSLEIGHTKSAVVSEFSPETGERLYLRMRID